MCGRSPVRPCSCWKSGAGVRAVIGAREFTTYPAELEIRQRGGGRELYARFPLGRTATVRSAGRVRKERFRAGDGGAAVSWQFREFQRLQGELADAIKEGIEAGYREVLEDALERRNTHLLVGHSYDKAVADTLTGNLGLRFSDDAVELTAELPAAGAAPSWVEDAARAVEGGQLRGVSPGFSVPAKGGERLVPEAGPGGSLVREITDSVVYEYSLVSRPAYSGTTAAVRRELIPLVPGPRRRIWWL